MPDTYGPPIDPLRMTPQGFPRGVVGPDGYPAEKSSGLVDFSTPALIAKRRMKSKKASDRHTAEKLQPSPPPDAISASGSPPRSTAY